MRQCGDDMFFEIPLRKSPREEYSFFAFGAIYTSNDVVENYRNNGLEGWGGQLLMHEYGHYLQQQDGGAIWYYMVVATTSISFLK